MMPLQYRKGYEIQNQNYYKLCKVLGTNITFNKKHILASRRRTSGEVKPTSPFEFSNPSSTENLVRGIY